jgi:hypothetical protein
MRFLRYLPVLVPIVVRFIKRRRASGTGPRA